MKQIATVTALPGQGVAEVTVARKTACGHDCENCAGCGAVDAGSFTVRAHTDISVALGDKVEIYTDQKVLSAAALVYLVPLALFLMGYMGTGFWYRLVSASVAEPLRYACGGLGFALGVVLAVVYDRYMRCKRAITYQILRKL